MNLLSVQLPVVAHRVVVGGKLENKYTSGLLYGDQDLRLTTDHRQLRMTNDEIQIFVDM